MPTSGKLIIFSAPSGAGKTTIVKNLLKQYPDKLAFSISATTREAREGEVDGKDYYFISKDDFLHKLAKQDFVEFEEVYTGTIYGTLRSEIERIWADGKCVIFDVDVIGALRLKKKFGEQALAIFVQPPSIDILKERLIGRGTDSPEKLAQRFDKAERELGSAENFDIILENYDLETACKEATVFVKYFLKGKMSFRKKKDKIVDNQI